MMSATVAWAGYGAGTLKDAPKKSHPCGAGLAPGPFPLSTKLFCGLNSAIALNAHHVARLTEAVRSGRREPGLKPELRAPEPDHGAGNGRAGGKDGYTRVVAGAGGIHETGELGLPIGARRVARAGGELAFKLRSERGQPCAPPRLAVRHHGAPQSR